MCELKSGVAASIQARLSRQMLEALSILAGKVPSAAFRRYIFYLELPVALEWLRKLRSYCCMHHLCTGPSDSADVDIAQT